MKNIKFFLFIISFLALTSASAQSESPQTKAEAPYFRALKSGKSVSTLPLKGTKANATITGLIADVSIEQTYINEGLQALEVVYVFPMSDKAAIYSLEMQIGNRVIRAKIKERQEAAREYDEARSNGNRATLLEQERPNVFTMNVANIKPGDEIKVTTKYTEYIVPDEGVYSFVYPTVVSPRYNAKGKKAKYARIPYTESGIEPSAQFTLNLEIFSSIPITYIGCKTHHTSINYPTSNSAVVNLSSDEIYSANRDFILNYTLKGQGFESGIQLYDHGDEKFFMAVVQPPARVTQSEIPPREYIFVVDVSGSMHGFPLEVSKKLLKNLISNLKSTDQFNVLLFSGSSDVLAPVSLYANKANIEKAIKFIGEQSGGGNTEVLGALNTSFALPRATKSLSRSVILVTDGYVTVEKEAMDKIRANLNNTNVFAFGIGSSVNRYLINGIAHVGGGVPFVVTNENEADSIATKFRKYIQTPVLANINVKYEGFKPYDLIIEKQPDIMSERPIVIIGKYRGSSNGKLILSGNTGKGKIEKVVDINDDLISASNSAIRYLWAREKIKIISDLGAESMDEKAVKATTDLGLKYNLLTEYTSFIAVDKKEVVTKNGELVTVEQVSPMPSGVSNFAIGANFDLVGSFMVGSSDYSSFLWITSISLIIIFALYLIFLRKRIEVKSNHAI
jgi:Ca-activated chloride channel homolog